MNQEQSGPQGVFENIRLMQSCPLCNTDYPKSGIRVVQGDGSGAHLLHMECQTCAGAVVAMVIESGMGVSSVGMITDMNYDDVIRFGNESPISADDCLHLHMLLNSPSIFAGALQSSYGLSTKRQTQKSKGQRRTQNR